MTDDGDRSGTSLIHDADDGDDEASVGDESAPSNAEYTVAFTPRQVAVGFAILAGLVAFALSRRRRKRSRGH